MNHSRLNKLVNIFLKSSADYQAMQTQAHNELKSIIDFPLTTLNVSLEASDGGVSYIVSADLYYPEDVEAFKQKVLSLPSFQNANVRFNVRDLGLERQRTN